MRKDSFLVVSDAHLPYEHEKALVFVSYLKSHFKIPDENVYCSGDLLDQFHGGSYGKGANFPHSPRQEILIAKDKIRQWAIQFPQMKMALGNHETRWQRKAFEAEMPQEMIMECAKLFGYPPGWRTKKSWVVPTKKPFIVEHGDDYGGQFPHVNAALNNGMSTVIGHFHSAFGVEHVKTNGLELWGAIGGCLIDFDAYSFDYARNARRKPILGCVVVLDKGRYPIAVPMV